MATANGTRRKDGNHGRSGAIHRGDTLRRPPGGGRRGGQPPRRRQLARLPPAGGVWPAGWHCRVSSVSIDKRFRYNIVEGFINISPNDMTGTSTDTYLIQPYVPEASIIDWPVVDATFRKMCWRCCTSAAGSGGRSKDATLAAKCAGLPVPESTTCTPGSSRQKR